MFRSYTAEPSRPQASMALGLDSFRDPVEQRLPALLLQPAQSD